MTTTHFTKTETLRRLRIGRALMRKADFSISASAYTEVGLRVDPNAYPTLEAALNAPENDLSDFWPLKDAATSMNVREHGYIANIYVYEGDSYSGLHDVQNVWLGTPEHGPVLLGRNGRLWTEEDLG